MRRFILAAAPLLWAVGWALVGAGGSSTAFAQRLQALSGVVAATDYDEQQLRLFPAAEPAAPLALQLLPPLAEREPGNAAVIYNKVGLWLRQTQLDQQAPQVDAYLEAPWEELPLEQVENLLLMHERLFGMLRQAGRRTTCDWQLPIGEESFVSILLPEVQEARGYGRLLVLKARVEALHGRYAEAVATLQDGFALARHVSAGPTLINGLVGVALATQFTAELHHLSSRPDAPNLYWAVSTLPQPLIDFRPAIETEMDVLFLSYPLLREAETATTDPVVWQELARQMQGDLQVLGGASPDAQQVGLAAIALSVYPRAKQALLDAGRDPRTVEAMPVLQVVAIEAVREYRELRDRQYKWALLPDGELQAALSGLRRSAVLPGEEILPLAALLLPPLESVRLAPARLARRLALQRTVEALRLHAAAHGGQWPQTLAEIESVPVPLDPLTQQPFTFVRDGDSARLEAPPLSESGVKGIRLQFALH